MVYRISLCTVFLDFGIACGRPTRLFPVPTVGFSDWIHCLTHGGNIADRYFSLLLPCVALRRMGAYEPGGSIRYLRTQYYPRSGDHCTQPYCGAHCPTRAGLCCTLYSSTLTSHTAVAPVRGQYAYECTVPRLCLQLRHLVSLDAPPTWP